MSPIASTYSPPLLSLIITVEGAAVQADDGSTVEMSYKAVRFSYHCSHAR